MGGSRPSRALIIVGSLILVGVVSALLYLAFAEAADAVRIPMTTWVPKSDNASLIHGVYQFIFILAGAVFVAIMALTLIFALLFKERPGQVPRQFHGNSRLEVVWTLVPVLIEIGRAHV